MKAENSRNYNIELWRIVFCVVIVIYHFGITFGRNLLGAGYLCVEFYFLLSGLGIYMAYQKGKEQGIKGLFPYAKSRFLRLYPLYIASMAAMLISDLITHQIVLSEVPGLLKNCLAEFFMLQCSPLGNSVLVYTNWYVATLFWGSLLYMLILLLLKKAAVYVICPLTGIGLYYYYARLIAKIDVIVSYHGFLRALAGLGLGIFLAALAEAVTHLRDEKAPNTENSASGGIWIILVIPANLLLIYAVYYFGIGVRSLKDFVMIGLFFAALFLLVSGKDPVPKKGRKMLAVASRLTYPVYLFQLPVLQLLYYLSQR
ncbi:MAG: acyltransferase family protein [Lachnospiraceae bacterium]|nr:acyltransferase family protein [Lachnospiraceae bacterium]